jgi:hypothetical protein
MLNGMLVGVALDNTVWYKDTIFGDWIEVTGRLLKQVTINEVGNLCGIDLNNKLWFKKSARIGFWKNVFGDFIYVDCKDKAAWAIDTSNKLWKRLFA